MTSGINQATIARFWNRVNKSSGCWEWMGARNPYRGDYGIAWVRRTGDAKGKTLLAHRVSWEIANGPIPDGFLVCHHCDNPPCVRPDHLFLGTDESNTADRILKGRTGPDFSAPAPKVRTVRWPIQSKLTPQKARAPGVRAAPHSSGSVVPSEPRRNGRSHLSGKLYSSSYQPRHWVKLTDDMVREIRRRRLEGERSKDLAAEFGVSKATIWNIMTGRYRSSVT